MRKRTKLRKRVHTNPSISSKIMSTEQYICESHSKEKLYDETLAVTRIKSDPNFFFRYANKFSGQSCLSALLNVFDNLMNSSTTVDMIYLDFSKAFDKVDHGIVLHKLRDLGITGNLGVWFHQFLSDGTQSVQLPGGVVCRKVLSLAHYY